MLPRGMAGGYDSARVTDRGERLSERVAGASGPALRYGWIIVDGLSRPVRVLVSPWVRTAAGQWEARITPAEPDD